MRIMVFDVPASTGGAITILDQYYDKAKKDITSEWIFVLGNATLNETNNLKVIRFPWIKKSWIHRLFFDYIVAPRIVRQYNPHRILSLQNVLISRTKVKQTLYLHQPLPFIEKKYGIFEEPKFWIYQNIISKFIIQSIKKADEIIVQTNWMKNACAKTAEINETKITVIKPEIDNMNIIQYHTECKQDHIFIYPASALSYKNHKIIIDALIKIKDLPNKQYKIIFTLRGDENKYSKRLMQNVKNHNLPVEFVGSLSKEKVYEYYSKSTLLFPSYIETFGLPLLEARLHGCPIITSDCTFSREILDGYIKAEFFHPADSTELAKLINAVVCQ